MLWSHTHSTHSRVVIVEIFDHTLLSCSIQGCSTSSTLHVLCASTSTSASRRCSSAFAANSSTSSTCLFWPRLSATLTRFTSRSSVFVSLALEPTPDRVPEPDDPPTRTVGTGCETDRGTGCEPFLSNNSLLSRVLRFGLFPHLHLLSVARSWCARDGSRWTSLPDGFRFSGGHVRSQCSGHWPEIVFNQHQWEFLGVGDNQRVHEESHQCTPDHGSIPMLHARWLSRRCPDSRKRWRRWGISKGRLWTVLKADLAKARAALEETICGGRNRRVSQVHIEGGEAPQRAGHGTGEGKSFSGGGSGASREISGRAIQVPRNPRHSPRVTSDRAPTNGQFVAVRARCFGERVDSSQVHHLGGSVHSPSCEETSGLKADIVALRRTWSDSSDALPRSKRHHELVGGSTKEISTRHLRKEICVRLPELSRIFSEGARHLTELCSPDVNFQGDHCLHQCGYLGCRVGEASNPGPVQTRQARRVEHDRVIADTAQDSVSTTRRRRRRLRPLPWSWDSDSDLDEPVQSQVRSQRSCPVTQVDASATVPASSGALFTAGLPEHGFPTSDTQHNRMLVFRRRTVGRG